MKVIAGLVGLAQRLGQHFLDLAGLLPLAGQNVGLHPRFLAVWPDNRLVITRLVNLYCVCL